MNHNTIVINLIGGPGVGKSTLACELFAFLKKKHYEVELVSEFSKELVWLNHLEDFNDRLYMHANQHHRMFVLRDKVDFMIVDSPLLLTSIYNRFYLGHQQKESYNQMIDQVVLETYHLYDNKTYYLERGTDYVDSGRRESSLEAFTIDENIKVFLNQHQIEYQTVNVYNAMEFILKDLNIE